MGGDNGPIRCDGCDYEPASIGLDLHIGAMLSPRLAILGEYAVTAQQLDGFGNTTLNQHMVLAAAKLWLLPSLWIKGGLGVAILDLTFDDGFVRANKTIDTGVGSVAAIGIELLSTPRYALDLQLRLASGNYESFDTNVNSGLLQVGVAWF